MDYDAALRYMQSLHTFGIKLGNERMEQILARLDSPHRGYDVLHVTGTKGKGSTTVMAACILQEHGLRTGGYYSPYVYDVRERVQVDGEMIPPEEFARHVARIAPIIEALAGTELGQATEFELKTAVGFLHFTERQVDAAAVEVGIGGRLDATNVVSPAVTVITNVGLDHTHILGDTVEKIAVEKAGIVKRRIPCITAAVDPDALRVIRSACEDREARLIRVAQHGEGDTLADVIWRCGRDGFTVRTSRAEYGGIRPRMRGEFQGANAACAIAAVEELAASLGLEVEAERVRAGLAGAYLPGRMEVVRAQPTVLMDGAHNGLAAEALAREVRRLPHRRLLLVAGMVGGHNPSHVLAPLATLAARVFATQPTWSRAIPAEQLAEAARAYCPSVEVHTPPLAAARAAIAEAESDDLVLITGSFYVVGDISPAELTPHG